MEPINLTDDQRLYLQAIFDYFLLLMCSNLLYVVDNAEYVGTV